MELPEHVRNALSVVLVGSTLVLHVYYEDFLRFDASGVLEPQMCFFCLRCLSSLVVFGRTFRFLDNFSGVCLSLPVCHWSALSHVVVIVFGLFQCDR